MDENAKKQNKYIFLGTAIGFPATNTITHKVFRFCDTCCFWWGGPLSHHINIEYHHHNNVVQRSTNQSNMHLILKVMYHNPRRVPYCLFHRSTSFLKGRVQNSLKPPTSNGILGLKCDVETLSTVSKYDLIG